MIRTRLFLLVALVVFASLWVAGAAAAATPKTVWLCRPGVAPDPCTPGLSTTVYSPKLKPLRVEHPVAVKHPAIDCFYVYPTVSDQKTRFANLHIDPIERSIALWQAARYSQYCSVYAPVYRQRTILGIAGAGTPNQADPVGDVRAAFRTYVQKYNHGRGFLLIGHSQGSFVLRQLIADDVDPKPSVRRRMVSAILLGGNVLVKRGKDVGGDFQHIRACRSAHQIGCVIAFSTFGETPPPDAIFGRTSVEGEQVLCTNPAALGGGSGLLDPIAPSKPFAPGSIAAASALLGLKLPSAKSVWLTFPRAYSARCSTAGGASVLRISPRGGAPVFHPSPNAMWGLHLLDANVGLGNLLGIVRSEISAFAAPRH